MKVLDEAVVQLASRQHGAFTRRQAMAIGLAGEACDRRVRSGLWVRSGQSGVYVLPGHARSWHQGLMVPILGGPTGAAASHRSAAVLHRLMEGTPIEVTVPPAGNHRLGVLVHRGLLDRRDRCLLAGVPATRVERTLVDLAAVVGDDALERAVEAALRLGLTTADRVRKRLDELAAPGRPGVVRLRRVLERRVQGRPAGSELEVRLIQLLRGAGLPELVRQHEVVLGGQRYFLDLADPVRRLAIELDGAEAHGPAQFQHDRTRQNALVLAGWTVLRFTWADVVERPEAVLAAIVMAEAA